MRSSTWYVNSEAVTDHAMSCRVTHMPYAYAAHTCDLLLMYKTPSFHVGISIATPQPLRRGPHTCVKWTAIKPQPVMRGMGTDPWSSEHSLTAQQSDCEQEHQSLVSSCCVTSCMMQEGRDLLMISCVLTDIQTQLLCMGLGDHRFHG